MSINDDYLDWDSLLAESSLPADEFTWTDGSNYGLDGYHHEQTMGEGLNNGTLPGSSPGGIRDTTMATLGDIPDELFSDPTDVSFVDADPLHVVEDGFDLSVMLAESEFPIADSARTAVSIVDLEWLDPTQEQDIARLPKEKTPGSAPIDLASELEKAWGVSRRTDGIKLVPNKDRESEAYNESLRSPPPALPGVRAASEKFNPAVRRAIRRSHYGHPLKEIARELVDTLGDSDPRLATVMGRIAADHGLAGTVFINAHAFPGLKNGKWVEELRKSARSAVFVITSDDTVASKLGKIKTSALHWGKVLDVYRPRLEAAGYKLGSGEPKEILRRAFLIGPEDKLAVSGHKPIETRPADSISASEAFSQLAASGKAEVAAIVSWEERAIAQKRVALRKLIGTWFQAGKLDKTEALRLAHSKAPIVDIQRVIARLVQMTGKRTYNAANQHIPKNLHVLRRKAMGSLCVQEAALEAALKQKFVARLAKQIHAGLLTKGEVQKILAMDEDVSQLERIATMVIQQAGQYRKANIRATESREYEGHEFRATVPKVSSMGRLSAYQLKVVAHSEKTGVDAREYFALLKYATKEMNEGMIGKNLTAMLDVRFTPELLRAASPLIEVLRAEHEGLAGTIYVDASAYAKGTGAKGCEEGALRHRANQIRTVLAMPRCGGCIHVSGGSCNVYRKPLINAASDVVSDVAATKKQMTYLADAHDAEITASLFTPSEFNLGSSMDNLDLTDQGSVEKLGEIMFGGLMLGEDG